MHSALSIANYLLSMARTYSECLTPMQLIKLVYLCHGWTLGLLKHPLIVEDVEAWKYGPVIRDLYHSLKQYKNNPISGPLCEVDTDVGLRGEEEALVQAVYKRYGHLSGPQLSALTHKKGSPWEKTWEAWGKHHFGAVIPQHLIQSHYEERAKQAG